MIEMQNPCQNCNHDELEHDRWGFYKECLIPDCNCEDFE